MKFQKTPIAIAAFALFAAAPAVIPSSAQAAPTVSFSAPAAGATVSQNINQTSQCAVSGQRIQRVVFSIRGSGASSWTTLNTETSSPWQCNIDPSRFASGQYTLRAVARDSGGATTTATRSINISNGGTGGGGNPVPSVSFRTPSTSTQIPAGGGLSTCEATATDGNGIQQVQFFMNNALYRTDTSAPYNCTFAAKQFPSGAYTLKAVATDRLGATASAQIGLTIGSATTPPANKSPSVSIMKPDPNATITAPLNSTGCVANASDSDGSISQVDFVLSNASTSKSVGSKTQAPYQCAINPAEFANGTYTLMATATDNAGAKSSNQRTVTISKAATDPGGGGGSSPIAPADIITRASADVPFSQQSGYTAQVINKYTSASQIPESGIHGSTLPTGETMRLGKTSDPVNSLRNALAFQVRNSDPTTSSGKRSELSVNPNIEMDKVYWVAFRAYIYDWGTLATNDNSLFGAQMHTGDNQAGVGGPSFGLYTTQNGRMFRVQARYSTSSTPSSGNSVSLKFAEYPIPFGRWTDFVLKFKHNTSGNGFLQVWMDGAMIANHQGSLGYNTGMKDYAKFGYYNWSDAAMSSTPRKVLLRAPTIVADPTGQTYSPEQLRTLVGSP